MTTSLHDRTASFKSVLAWLGFVFFIALAVRMVHLFQILPAPFFPFKMGDAASYDTWAQTIAAGDWLGSQVFYQAPLYPYFLGTVYTVFGDDMFSIRLCQAIVGAASCVLLAAAGWRIFSRGVGVLAGMVLALYAPAVFFDSLVQKSVLDAFFLCLALVLYGGLLQRASLWRWCGLGATVGFLVLCRENALVFAPAVLAWIPFAPRARKRAGLQAAGCFLGGMGLVLLPVSARNFVVGGEFHLTTSQFGPNLYIGNHAKANGSYQPLRPHRGSAKYEQQDARELAELAVGRQLSPAEVSRYWTRQAAQFVRDDPRGWLRLMARKLVLTWNAIELVDTEDQYTYAEWSRGLWLSGFVVHFGVLVPLAVFGAWCTWHRRRELLLLYLIVVFYALSVVVFYVVGRYRYPLAPPLILLAAAGVCCARGFLRSVPRWKAAAAVASSVSVAVFCNWPVASADAMRAITHYNVGVELDAVHRYEEAIGEYLLSAKLDPGGSAVYNNLGCGFLEVGQTDRAVECLVLAVANNPDFTEARYNLGRAYLAQRRWNDARECFQELARRNPDMAQAHFGLAVAAHEMGDAKSAREALRRTLAIDASFEAAAMDLGLLKAAPSTQD